MTPSRWSSYVFFSISTFSILVLFLMSFFDIQEVKWRLFVKPRRGTANNNSNSLNFSSTSVENMNTARRERYKTLMLVYTPFFGNVKWVRELSDPFCGFERKFLASAKKCLSGDFEVTYDKQRFTESDLVVFHARNMPGVDVLKTLLPSRPTSQRWVYALWESPNATPNPAPLNGLFNSTWTYRTDSEFWSPYGSYEELSPEEQANKTKNIPDYIQGKSELVAWLVSNCGAQPRMSFVHELTKYIKVDVFGGCSQQFGESRSCPNPPSNCLKKYKFYLSFENALCEDYITEKYWGRLGKISFILLFIEGHF